jgi:hypothetical protein
MTHIYEAVEKKNPGNNRLRQFAEWHHGWMGARANVSWRRARLALCQFFPVPTIPPPSFLHRSI